MTEQLKHRNRIFKNKKYFLSLSLLFNLILAQLLLTSCTRVHLMRTLPDEIQSIAIPMFKNKTHETGLEELATNFTVEEILADGRIKVVSKNDADAWLEVTIKQYSNMPNAFNDDEFNMSNKMEVSAEMKVWLVGIDKPIGVFTVTAEHPFIADARYSTTELPVDAKELLMRDLSYKITLKLLTGNYKEKIIEK